MSSSPVRVGDFVVMDEVCWQVTGIAGRIAVGDYALRRLAGGTSEEASESLVPIQMLSRLIALGEAVLARDVNAS